MVKLQLHEGFSLALGARHQGVPISDPFLWGILLTQGLEPAPGCWHCFGISGTHVGCDISHYGCKVVQIKPQYSITP